MSLNEYFSRKLKVDYESLIMTSRKHGATVELQLIKIYDFNQLQHSLFSFHRAYGVLW